MSLLHSFGAAAENKIACASLELETDRGAMPVKVYPPHSKYSHHRCKSAAPSLYMPGLSSQGKDPAFYVSPRYTADKKTSPYWAARKEQKNMEIKLACTVISAEPIEQSTYARTGEVTPARGEIYILTSDRGKPVCKKVSCSHTMALEMEKRDVGLAAGDVVKETLLPIDIAEYKLDNGKSGVSIKLVEPKDVPKEHFLDLLGLAKNKNGLLPNGSGGPSVPPRAPSPV